MKPDSNKHPKQLTIFDYTTETLNFHNHENLCINAGKGVSKGTP